MKQDTMHHTHRTRSMPPVGGAIRRLWGRRNGQGGFTLIEMMVVIAIIGVLAGFATLSHMSHLPHKRLMGATHTLLGDLKHARSLAVRENTPFMVCFDAAAGSYQIGRVTDPAANDCADAGVTVITTETLTTRYPGVIVSRGTTGGNCPGGGNTAVTFNTDRAVFSNQGSSVTAPNSSALYNTGTVYLTNNNGRVPETVCIRVLGAIGTVRAFTWKNGGWT